MDQRENEENPFDNEQNQIKSAKDFTFKKTIEIFKGEGLRGKKALVLDKPTKTYTITITLVQMSDEEAKIKRSIVESMMRKSYFNLPRK